jgi:hypothetical protein
VTIIIPVCVPARSRRARKILHARNLPDAARESQRKEEVRRKETLKEEERKNSAIIRYLKNWEGEIEGDGSQKASKKRARSGKESMEETRIKGSKANGKAAKRSVRGKECGS